MSALPASQTIVFAINSAIKMGRNIQRAYAKSLREKSIVLPLPDFDAQPNETDIQEFFDHPEREAYVEGIERLAFLHEKAGETRLERPELEEYREFYFQSRSFAKADLAGALVEEDFITLLRIRQWEKGLGGPGERPTALRLVAGTVVEIGIDYFQHFPGALNTDSAHGKAIHHFLDALDEISFSEQDISFGKLISQRVVPRLFAATAETIRDLAPQLSNDPKLQQFIKTASHKIAHDLYDRIGPDTLDSEREKTVQWGQLILSSVIRHAGTTFFTQSGELLGTGDPEAKLIESTGLALLGVIIDEKDDTVHFNRALTGEGLDQVVRASMGVIAQHPELVSKKQGVREIIAGVSASIEASGINRPGLAPELVRLVLEQTAGNLHLLWDADRDQPEHLLVITVRELLNALALKGPEERWKPSLTRDQLINLAYLLTDEVVNNPVWITQKVGSDSLMAHVLRSALQSLQQIPADQRFHSEVLAEILQVSMQAVVTSPHLVKALDEEGSTILSKSLNLIFAALFPADDSASPSIEKAALLKDLLAYTYDVILANNPGKRGLILIELIVFKENGFDFARSFDSEWADRLIDAATTALAESPELLTDEKSLQNIIGRIAGALKETPFNQPGLLPEMARLVLLHTAGELNLLLSPSDASAAGEFRYLLVETVEQVLLAFTQKEEGRRWQPKLTSDQIIDISEFFLEEVAANPQLVSGKPFVLWTTQATLETLQAVKKQQPPSYGLFRILLRHATAAVQRERALLNRIDESTGNTPSSIRLTEALLAFVGVLFDPGFDERVQWNLTQDNILESLLEIYLFHVTEVGATEDGIENLESRLRETIRLYANQSINSIEELLQQLQENLA